MSNFKLSFTLKQHTPIIHFQADQAGATLRATELKPKLDRFLIEYVFKNDFEQYKPFLMSGQDGALDYKVKFIAKKNRKIEFEKYPPLYFGNQRGSKPKQKMFANEVVVEFLSFKEGMLTAIGENFEAFLSVTNFGTRQSKGYGCFYLKDKEFDTSLVDQDKFTKVYAFECSKNRYEEDIKSFYTLMRSGINIIGREKQNLFYAKSLLFLYFNKRGIIWDKKAVKTHFIENKKDTTNQYIIRDLLGLSTFQNWKSYGFNVQKQNSEISRFKSPIIIKPFISGDRVKVYFFAKKFERKDPMLNKPFTIRGKGSFTIKTPAIFDIEDFLKFVKDIDLNMLVDKKYQNSNKYFNSLERLFNTLKVVS